MLARIVSICDAHDAMTNRRPYQAAEPSDHALRVLAEDRGRDWDRQLVAVFLRLVAEGKFRNLRPPE